MMKVDEEKSTKQRREGHTCSDGFLEGCPEGRTTGCFDGCDDGMREGRLMQVRNKEGRKGEGTMKSMRTRRG